MEFRLGDVIDDYCIKCRRLTNHSVVSLMEGQVAKVRCRSCYHEHTYLHEQAPPSRKDLKKAELLAQAANSGSTPVEEIPDGEQATSDGEQGTSSVGQSPATEDGTAPDP